MTNKENMTNIFTSKLNNEIGNNDILFVKAMKNKNAYICRFMIKQNRDIVKEIHERMPIICLALDCLSEEIAMNLAEVMENDELKTINYDNGDNLLMRACQIKMYRLIRYLLLCGLEPTSKDSEGKSVLEWMIIHGNNQMIELLIDHYNIDINQKNSKNEPMIFMSMEKNNAFLSELMLRSGVDIDVRDNDGMYLLEKTIQKGWYLHTSYLIKNGSKCIYNDYNLFRRLCHIAVEKNSSITFYRLLINYSAYKIQHAWRYFKCFRKLQL